MPLPVRRQYRGAAASTTITGNILAGDTSVSIAANTGWPSGATPFYVVIDPGTSAEEKCLATISGTALTITRAQDGTAAVAHSSGAAIYPVFTAVDADQANELASKMTTKGDLLTTDGSGINRLSIGTNTHVLQADSAATNGVKWGQVATAGIADAAITTAKFATGAVDAAALATDSVTTVKILNANVTTAKIADGAVTAVKLDAAAAIQPTVIDAKGDLIAGTAADTVARLAVGTNNQILTADSTQTTGMKWASQIVTAIDSATVTTNQGTNSTSYTDLTTAGPAVTLTTGTTVIVMFGARYNDDANTGNDGYVSFAVSGATTIAATDTYAGFGDGTVSVAASNLPLNYQVKLTTLTAGSNTFTLKYKKANGTGNAGFSYRWITVIAL